MPSHLILHNLKWCAFTLIICDLFGGICNEFGINALINAQTAVVRNLDGR
jgi:hypothetical protein